MASLGRTVLITGHKHSARTACINDRRGVVYGDLELHLAS